MSIWSLIFGRLIYSLQKNVPLKKFHSLIHQVFPFSPSVLQCAVIMMGKRELFHFLVNRRISLLSFHNFLLWLYCAGSFPLIYYVGKLAPDRTIHHKVFKKCCNIIFELLARVEIESTSKTEQKWTFGYFSRPLHISIAREA